MGVKWAIGVLKGVGGSREEGFLEILRNGISPNFTI